MSIALITSNVGYFDTIKLQPKQDIEITYQSFSHNNFPFPFQNTDHRLQAKYFKMLAHEQFDHDILIWMDGNVQIKTNHFVKDLVNALGDADICLSIHPFRSSVYEEAAFIIDGIANGNKYLQKRYSADAIQRELNAMPADLTGLYWCGLFARRNTPKVNAAFEDWFMDNVKWSNFDQNSFVKMIHKHGLKVNAISWGEFYDNENYSLVKHKG